VNYLEKQVPDNFFFSEEALDSSVERSELEKEFDSPLLQREIDIIGKVMLRATHVKLQECDGPKDYRFCYPILDLLLEQFSTSDLREGAKEDESLSWAVHKTASQLGLEEKMIVGELSSYPNSGYALTFDASTTSREDYLSQLKDAEGALFGNGARIVTLDFATYSDTLNYWVYVHLLFEFSISDQVIFSKSF